jgi:hypothetical protein
MNRRHAPAIERRQAPLMPLGELRMMLAVADGEPDIRGWRLLTRAGIDVGEVTDLVVDVSRLRVRYLMAMLDPPFAVGRDQCVLVPVGVAQLDGRRDEVLVRSGPASLLTAPMFSGCPIARDYERALLRAYGWRDAVPDSVAEMDDFYRGPYFDERSCFAGRRDRTDRAYLRRVADDNLAEVRR